MLCIAGLLILLMIGLVLYDATATSKDKVTVQGAADMAAMSQASVKARSMNMLAYSNIAKRSIFSIHSTYISSFIAYGQLAQLLNWIGSVLCNLDVDCTLQSLGENAILRWRTEAETDFANFSGLDGDELKSLVQEYYEATNSTQAVFDLVVNEACGGGLIACLGQIASGLKSGESVLSQIQTVFESIQDSAADLVFSGEDLRSDVSAGNFKPSEWGGLTEQYYAQDLKALDNYQRFTAGITPWWAWMESLSRGLRNGATAASSAPLPDGMPRPTEDLAEQLSQSFNYPVSLDGTQISDVLPVRPGIGPRTNKQGVELKPKHPNEELMYRNLADQLDDQSSALISDLGNKLRERENSPSLGQAVLRSPAGVEYFANMLITLLQSRWPEGESAIMEAGFAAVFTLWTHNTATSIDGGARLSQEIMDAKLGPYVANPWILNRYRSEADWLAHSSNIVFTYLNRPEDEKRREKYDYVETDQRRRAALSRTFWESIYRADGQWGIARSEISFQGEAGTEPDLWHPVWSARMRPVALEGEFAAAPFTIKRAFHDALGGLGVSTLIGAAEATELLDAVRDFAQMERAASGMGPATAEGVVR